MSGLSSRIKGRFVCANKKSHIKQTTAKINSYNKRADSVEESRPKCITSESGNWREGRRIIELGLLADQMRACCDCGHPLHLHNIESETRSGLGSLLYITCTCGVLNTVSTGKRHRAKGSGKRGNLSYDVNSKAALGMVHAGLTHSQMENFLTTLEIRGLHPKSLKGRMSEIGPCIDTVATQSCEEALHQEAAHAQASNDLLWRDVELSGAESLPDRDCQVTDVDTLVNLDTEQCCSSSIDGGGDSKSHTTTHNCFKYDMAWQRRGTGHSYNSKSGVGTLIGNETGKICGYGIRTTDCRKCNYHETKNTPVPMHVCEKNWTGSSKAMESDVGLQLVKDVEKQSVSVDVLIMDDDATTMARINTEIPHPVEKWSDINHTMKNLGKSLYTLAKKHKILTANVIKYLTKCFTYAISQNKGNADECRLAIKQIVPHAFGCHDECGSWCGYKKDPTQYRHSTLNGDLEGDSLRADLDAIFDVYANRAERLAPGGSTKDVESFNSMISTKAPKRCHFSSTANLRHRVGCAVAQKNLGMSYVQRVNGIAGLSPGKVSTHHGAKHDKTRKRHIEYVNNRAYKRRKIEKRVRKKLFVASMEKKEGVTYQSGIDVGLRVNQPEMIPPPAPSPVAEKINSACNKVFCDIETSSLALDADILQIAAKDEDSSFNAYVTPTRLVAPGASAATGFTTKGGVLFHHGSPLATLPLRDTLSNFSAWMDERGPVALIGHNMKTFDFPRILRAFTNNGLEKVFARIVVGGIDTLPLFRQVHPNQPSYKQEALVQSLLGKSYAAHDALADVTALKDLFDHSNVDDGTVTTHSFTTNWSISDRRLKDSYKENVASYGDMINDGVITRTMAGKLGRTGLHMKHLLYAHRQTPCYVMEILSEKVNSRIRVTKDRCLVDNICKYLDR